MLVGAIEPVTSNDLKTAWRNVLQPIDQKRVDRQMRHALTFTVTAGAGRQTILEYNLLGVSRQKSGVFDRPALEVSGQVFHDALGVTVSRMDFHVPSFARSFFEGGLKVHLGGNGKLSRVDRLAQHRFELAAELDHQHLAWE